MPQQDPHSLSSTASEANRRKRLPSALRIEQILDAALQAFSARGYADTRMEDIARGAGLSKGGLYVHFASKEEVLQALLDNHLAPQALDAAALLDGVETTRQFAERLVTHLYGSLANPAMIGTMRLLLAESARVPQVIERWRRTSLDGSHADVGRLLALAAQRGLCGQSVAMRHPWLLLSPIVATVVMAIVAGPLSDIELAQRRQAHVEMCCELLVPHTE